MEKSFIWGAIAALVVVCLGAFFAFTPKGFTEKEIEGIVHEYIMKNPDVVIKSVQSKQLAAQAELKEKNRSIVASRSDELFESNSPFLGNPNGDILLVKFTDYQCSHCKSMEPVIEELISKNPELKVIIKETPIRGPGSIFAAKAALASDKQDKFPEFHKALLSTNEELSEETVLNLAESVGLDVDQLKFDMENEKIEEDIREVFSLARELSLKGTPFFILAQESDVSDSVMFIPGAASEQHFQEQINKLK